MWEKVYAGYCERQGDPSFWAEPINAISNGGFVVAGAWLVSLLLRDADKGARPRDPLSWILVALIVAIGIGSFLFHTLAVRWSLLADVIPIALFMLAGVFAIGRRCMQWPLWAAWAAVFGFIGLRFGSSALGNVVLAPAEGQLQTAWQDALGGVFGYGPALIVLAVSAIVMLGFADGERREAGRRLLAASGVFAASLALRTIDEPLCGAFTVSGVPIGTHFLWHLLNALVLYLTASALIGLAPARRRARANAAVAAV